MNIDAHKKQLRQQIKLEKRKLTKSQIQRQTIEVFEKVELMTEFIQAQHVLCYWSLPDEMNTHSFIERWFNKKSFYLPRVIGDDIEVVPFTGLKSMIPGLYNILEPGGCQINNLDVIDVIIVPGMAFSIDGARLGRGGGYYDRFLTKVPNAIKIGVAYKIQVKPEIPTQIHDVKMDRVIF